MGGESVAERREMEAVQRVSLQNKSYGTEKWLRQQVSKGGWGSCPKETWNGMPLCDRPHPSVATKCFHARGLTVHAAHGPGGGPDRPRQGPTRCPG